MGCGCGKKTPVLGGRKKSSSSRKKKLSARKHNSKNIERTSRLKALVKASKKTKKRTG
jgi:hypothetical protein